MIGGKRLIVVTPAGRRRYLEVLAEHVLRDPDVDEWRLWMNTTDQGDIGYVWNTLLARDRRATVRSPSWPVDGTFSIAPFFAECGDPDAVYVRLDDDVVWCGPRAISRLAAKCLADSGRAFLVFGNILNSALSSWHHQKEFRLPPEPAVGHFVMDPVGWGDGGFAVALHRRFLAAPRELHWKLADRRLDDYQRHSINAVAWRGEDAADWCPLVPRDEEAWLAHVAPKERGRPCLVSGDQVFCHLAFHTQRAAVDAASDVLEGYRRLAGL